MKKNEILKIVKEVIRLLKMDHDERAKFVREQSGDENFESQYSIYYLAGHITAMLERIE